MTVLSKRKRAESDEDSEVMLYSNERLRVYATGDIFRVANGTYAKPYERGDGYSLVKIGGKMHRVHRIVCLAFHGAMQSDKPHVNHKNGIRSDNSAANLEWTSIPDKKKRSRVR